MSARRAVLVFVVLVGVLGTAVLLAALAMRGPTGSTPSETVLVFNVPERIDEAQPPAGGLFDLVRRDRPTVWDVSHGIRHAAGDPHVVGLVLHIEGIDWGWAKVAEIRDAISAFRRTGKPVYAALSGGGEREYLLATSAGTIASPPLAVLQLDGLSATALFMRGTLDKVGVTPNFAQAGKYKTAVEEWTRTGLTPPSREALQALVDDQHGLLVDSLAAGRGLPRDSVARLIDDGPYDTHEALAHGLIDTLLYRSELDSLATSGPKGRRPTTSLTRYLDRIDESGSGPRVALVMAVGTIAEGRSRGGPGEGDVLGAETIIRALRDVRDRSSIEAVVLRIDSPGGSAQASDQIWHEVRRCAERKPVVISMSDLAASGGYYIAAAGDTIVAQPSTLTGSIGAFGGKLNLLGLYHKLGLNVETVSRGKHAEMLSPFRDFTPEEAARFQGQMDGVYRTFLGRVAEGRHRSIDAIDSVAQGRVWTGVSASTRGLVDVLGGLDRAFAIARERADIAAGTPLTIEVFPHVQRTFFQRMLADMVSEEDDDDSEVFGRVSLPPVVQAWLAAATFPSGNPLALMPWSIEIR